MGVLRRINSYDRLNFLAIWWNFENLEQAYPVIYGRNDCSTIKTAKVLGNSCQAAASHLKKLGIKLQQRGGNHGNQWTKNPTKTENNICSVKDCINKTYRRFLCDYHYEIGEDLENNRCVF
jgi:hypothetical protein